MLIFPLIMPDLAIYLRDQPGYAEVGFRVETQFCGGSSGVEIGEIPEETGIVEEREQELFLKDQGETVLYGGAVPFTDLSGAGEDQVLGLYPVRLVIDAELAFSTGD